MKRYKHITNLLILIIFWISLAAEEDSLFIKKSKLDSIKINSSLTVSKDNLFAEYDSVKTDSTKIDSSIIIKPDSLNADSILINQVEIDSIKVDSIGIDSIKIDSIKIDSVATDSTIIDSAAIRDSLESAKRKEIFKDAFEMTKTQNIFDVITYVVDKTKPLIAVNIFGDLQNALYWKNKDLNSAIAFGQFGVEYAQIQAKKNELFYPELSDKLLREAANISFDIASFCWDGWDEKNVEINSSVKFIGYQAARNNLKLVKKLDLGDISLARSHWMLAGMYLSSKLYEKAIAHYNRSAYLAKRGGSISETLLAKAFEAMTKRLVIDSPDLQNEYKFYLENLKKQDDGKFFAAEVETAFKVYKTEEN